LLVSLQEQGRENTLLEICANYFSFEPGNPVLLTQYAYLACLNKLAEPAEILKAMEPLAKAFPQELPIQSVLATIYLCDGKPAKAAETLEALKVEPAKLALSYRAVYLVSQVLNRKIPKTDPQIVQFPWQSLQASERRKFNELIRSFEP
jgi:predicted Zn-dependent protease